MAFLRIKGGGWLVGYGPFEERAEPPVSGVAFYRNDFGLSDPLPWKVPARVEELAAMPEGAGDVPVVEWEAPSGDDFAEVFGEVVMKIGEGVLEKSVPVVTERGVLRCGSGRDFLGTLHELPTALRGYGWINGEESFVGSTPEELFQLKDGILTTMALAGTARSEDQGVFEVDSKEIREHEYVAGSLVGKLSDIGMVQRQPRRVMNLGPLVHFETPIRVELYRPEGAGELIRHMHPTPALGPLPRTGETMELLHDWRTRLGCPRWFGAPFGVWREGELTVLVAIRMVVWQGDNVYLPSGCGVIDESRLVNEWRELRLKRDSVKELFQIS
jgi:menaquinone-specific isochorismate synthase